MRLRKLQYLVVKEKGVPLRVKLHSPRAPPNVIGPNEHGPSWLVLDYLSSMVMDRCYYRVSCRSCG